MTFLFKQTVATAAGSAVMEAANHLKNSAMEANVNSVNKVSIRLLRNLIVAFLIAILSFTAMAQEERKVAVFDPAGNVESHLKEIVREEISSVIVNTLGYTVLERQLIDRVLAENRFQASGLVDDTQISEMGRLIGANFAFVASITTLGTNFHISCKLIDVQTARIERQRTAETQQGTRDLTAVVRRIVSDMLGQYMTPQTIISTQPATNPQAIAQSTVLQVESNQEKAKYLKRSVCLEFGYERSKYNTSNVIRDASRYSYRMRYTEMFSPTFGLDVVHFSFSHGQRRDLLENATVHTPILNQYQMSTGIRFTTSAFGKSKNLKASYFARIGCLFTSGNGFEFSFPESGISIVFKERVLISINGRIYEYSSSSRGVSFGFAIGYNFGKKDVQ